MRMSASEKGGAELKGLITAGGSTCGASAAAAEARARTVRTRATVGAGHPAGAAHKSKTASGASCRPVASPCGLQQRHNILNPSRTPGVPSPTRGAARERGPAPNPPDSCTREACILPPSCVRFSNAGTFDHRPAPGHLAGGCRSGSLSPEPPVATGAPGARAGPVSASLSKMSALMAAASARAAPALPTQRGSLRGAALASTAPARRRDGRGVCRVVAADFPKPPFESAGTFQEAASLSTKLMKAPRPSESKVGRRARRGYGHRCCARIPPAAWRFSRMDGSWMPAVAQRSPGPPAEGGHHRCGSGGSGLRQVLVGCGTQAHLAGGAGRAGGQGTGLRGTASRLALERCPHARR